MIHRIYIWSLNEILDEVHFLSKCTFHDFHERISLIENVYPVIQLDDKSVSSIDFKALVNSKNKHVLQALGCFVHTGFKKRDEHSLVHIRMQWALSADTLQLFYLPQRGTFNAVMSYQIES